MVEVETCLDGLLKPSEFVKTFKERKKVSVQELRSLLIAFSGEKENLLTMVVELRLVIEYLLLTFLKNLKVLLRIMSTVKKYHQ